jgi:putative endonuclease
MARNNRESAERIGRAAEHYAAFILRLKGYHIAARRVVTPFGEIDLIAVKGQKLIFIEVKYRRDKAALAASLSPRGQSRIVKAAHYYTSRMPKFQTLGQRFDLILTAPFGVIPLAYMRHLKDAWRAY